MTQTDNQNKPVVADFGPGHPFTGAPVIVSYSRAQALEDGVLINLTWLARTRGFRFDVACTERLYTELVTAGEDPEETVAQPAYNKRIGQLLNCLLMAIKAMGPERRDYITFTALTDASSSKAWAKAHPDDDGETPCLTIMLVGED